MSGAESFTKSVNKTEARRSFWSARAPAWERDVRLQVNSGAGTNPAKFIHSQGKEARSQKLSKVLKVSAAPFPYHHTSNKLLQ
jgi:hypothetical protein